jgi:hypothetical protein
LPASTNKKVLVLRFDRETLPGFVSPHSWLRADGLELLSTSGAVATIPYDEVRFVCFVRDFDQGEPRRELRTFTSRPKTTGLWLRLHFRDGEIMDGIMSNNLLQVEPQGFSFIPPDPGYQNQKVFVPRAALASIQVLGVVGSPLKTRRPAPTPKEQLEMFDKG